MDARPSAGRSAPAAAAGGLSTRPAAGALTRGYVVLKSGTRFRYWHEDGRYNVDRIGLSPAQLDELAQVESDQHLIARYEPDPRDPAR